MMKQETKLAVGTVTRKTLQPSGWMSGLFAVGLGSMTLLAVTAPRSAWAMGLQEPATPQAGTSVAPEPAQDAKDAKHKKLDKPAEEVDPLKRPLSDKQKISRQRELKHEISGAYKTWLNQDVVWIISDEERKAFKNLSNDEERDAFIEQFWLRRNPDPDSSENDFREEHYRRIAYANEHFAAGKPGWKTDRGHIYIAFGKPDSIESHPSGGMYDRPIEEGGGQTSTYPFETWHYRDRKSTRLNSSHSDLSRMPSSA